MTIGRHKSDDCRGDLKRRQGRTTKGTTQIRKSDSSRLCSFALSLSRGGRINCRDRTTAPVSARPLSIIIPLRLFPCKTRNLKLVGNLQSRSSSLRQVSPHRCVIEHAIGSLYPEKPLNPPARHPFHTSEKENWEMVKWWHQSFCVGWLSQLIETSASQTSGMIRSESGPLRNRSDTDGRAGNKKRQRSEVYRRPLRAAWTYKGQKQNYTERVFACGWESSWLGPHSRY